MKIAISAFSQSLNESPCPVFGRAPGFLIIELEKNKIKSKKFIKNPAFESFRGAGILAAQTIINERADILITMQLGPNAFYVLQQAGIKIYNAENTSIEQNIQKFLNGELQPLTQAAGRGFGRGRGGGFGRRMP